MPPRRHIAWIACLAVLFNMLAMPLSAATPKSSADSLLWGAFCSSAGKALVEVQGLAKIDLGQPHDEHSNMQHCWCCSGAAPLLALGGQPLQVRHPPQRRAHPPDRAAAGRTGGGGSWAAGQLGTGAPPRRTESGSAAGEPASVRRVPHARAQACHSGAAAGAGHACTAPGKAAQRRTDTSSTSKRSVALGGITPPAPAAP